MQRAPSLAALAVMSLVVVSKARAEPPPGAPSGAGPVARVPGADAGRALPAVRPLLVTPALARETVAAALRAAGSPEVSAALSSMAARARTSAVLPELFLRAARSTDDSLRLSPTVDNPYQYSALGGAGIWLEGRLVWHFDRLVFDRDEVAVERLRREHADSMAKLRAKVLDALFGWQRAVFRAEDPKANADELEQAALSRAEQEAVLDVLTAGWFTGRRKAPSP
ncbi:MAG TPA: hypothetical protein VH062_16495 [Polyangiaceae bacterium]|jgi:hypothetical protein|nr:hypothetical protein [Polyangiaceae bacterium]